MATKRRRRRGRIEAKFESECYFSYLSGCGDIKEGDWIINRGYRMNWHKRCQHDEI